MADAFVCLAYERYSSVFVLVVSSCSNFMPQNFRNYCTTLLVSNLLFVAPKQQQIHMFFTFICFQGMSVKMDPYFTFPGTQKVKKFLSSVHRPSFLTSPVRQNLPSTPCLVSVETAKPANETSMSQIIPASHVTPCRLKLPFRACASHRLKVCRSSSFVRPQ